MLPGVRSVSPITPTRNAEELRTWIKRRHPQAREDRGIVGTLTGPVNASMVNTQMEKSNSTFKRIFGAVCHVVYRRKRTGA